MIELIPEKFEAGTKCICPISDDEPCRDYIEITDLDTNQTLFSSCTESTRPVVVVSVREKVEVCMV